MNRAPGAEYTPLHCLFLQAGHPQHRAGGSSILIRDSPVVSGEHIFNFVFQLPCVFHLLLYQISVGDISVLGFTISSPLLQLSPPGFVCL